MGILTSLVINTRTLLSENAIKPTTELLKNGVSFSENPLVTNNTFTNTISMGVSTMYMYIKMMLVPNELSFYYGYNTIPILSLTTPLFWVQLIVIISTMFCCLYFYKKNILISYGILFFYLSLTYCSNINQPIAGIVANRYTFIASLGFCIFIVLLFNFVFYKKTKLNNILIFGITFFVLITHSITSYIRATEWRNIYSLIESDMPNLQNSFEANRIAANHFCFSAVNSKNENEKRELFLIGLKYIKNAQSLIPSNQKMNEMAGLTYYNLGNTAAAKKEFVNILNQNDTAFLSLEYLGDIFFYEKKYDTALLFYKKIIDFKPEQEVAYFKYLNASYKGNHKVGILSYFKKLQNEQPQNSVFSECLGYYYFFEKDTATGLKYFTKTISLKKSNNNFINYIQKIYLSHKDTTSALQLNKYYKNE